MIEVYYWENDPDGERIVELLKKKGLEHRAKLLDPEIPNARPYAEYKGKTYWDLGEFLRVLEKES